MKNGLPLPHSIEAEMIVIGMMLTLPDYNDHACQVLLAEDFYITNNKVIFNCLQKMYETKKAPELQVLIEVLKDTGDIERAGGIAYLRSCLGYVSNSYDFEAYVEIVKDKALKREAMLYFQQMVDRIPTSDCGIHEIIAECQDKIFEIEKKQAKSKIVTISDVFSGKASSDGLSFLDSLQKRQELRNTPDFKGFVGISTGINSLDRVLNGLCPSNFIVVAARPGVGKTAFLCHMCVDIAIKNQIPVGIFTLEMAPDQLIERFVSNYCDIPQDDIVRGDIGGYFVDMSTRLVDIKESPIYYYDGMNVNISSLVVGAKRMKELYGVKVIFIDYLQLLGGTSKFKNSDSRVNEVGEISRKLKLLAKELGVPIICLSQLNRNVEGRQNKEPMLSDLRDSGSIEQDADQVILLNRPDMYDPDRMPGVMVADVCKNRHGAPGKVIMSMEKRFCRLVDLNEAMQKEIQRARSNDES